MAGKKVTTQLTTKKYQVSIDRNLCIAAGSCSDIAQNTFGLDKDNLVILKTSNKTDSDDNILLAAQSCPVAAIKILNKKTKKRVWPR